MAKKRSKSTDEAYNKLGYLIFDENPYPKPMYPRSYDPKNLQIYGPGKTYDADDPFTFVNLTSAHAKRMLGRVKAAKLYKEGLTFMVGKTKRRMSKVIRIPYTHYDPDKKKQVPGAVVIAYEGAGGGG